MLGLSTAKVTQAAINGTSSNQTSAEAAQIAQSDAELLRSVSYQDVAPSSRKAVEGTPFQHEMTVSSESDFNSSVKQKTVTIKVFKGAETNPRSELRLTRYSVEQTASGVPVGTVITWASANNPNENGTWLECNGQSCTAYPELVRVLGSNTVPDYRGVFLRGFGSVTSTHYGTVQHQSAALGTLQGDSIRNIYGRFVVDDIVGNGGYNWQYSPNGAFQVVGSVNYDARSHESWNGRLVSFNTSYVVPTANEDRPINRAVRYFIKAA